jgi:superfamily II DNA or RNA helicase
MTSYGRDRRRRLTLEERRLVYARAGGQCQNCGDELGPGYHNAHMAAWAHGGATSVEQVQAWCESCNLRLGARDVEAVDDIELRLWQAQALPGILRRLWTTGVATLHAAPGAGKTIFAGAVFRHLADAGLVDRLVVVVPNRALITQWHESLGRLRIHVDTQPRDGVIEHQETVGAVVTYQSLPNAAAAHAVRLDRYPTLLVLDEVHHVGEKAAWSRAVQRMVGDINGGAVRAAGVLNMTGTLFRSSKRQRISTVQYSRIATDEGEKLQAVADWSEPTSNLIGIELRAPDLYAYGGEVRLIDIREEAVVTGDIADLDHSQRSAAIRNAFTSASWMRGFSAEAVRMLQTQLYAIGGEEPLKLLFVAHDLRSARRAADAINAVTQQDFARLVTSDEPAALRTLRGAAREPNPCAIVAVRMVTEGFDCPQVATIAYASNIIADLFIAQMMARAMRITITERANRQMLPAQILIPDHPALRRAFASALVGAMHVLDVEEEETPDATLRAGGGGERLPRYELLDLSDPRLRSATVLTQEDGNVLADELARYIVQCKEVGIPETYAPRVAVVSRRYRPPLRVYTANEQSSEPGASATTSSSTVKMATTTPADPRSLNLAHRARLAKAAGWMIDHIDHDLRYASVGVFQAQANEAANVPRGGRDQASGAQLQAAAEWMMARIIEHCEAHNETVPSWTDGGEA